MKNHLKTGFTLVEVLTALAIIGVVSAIVMPHLITETQKTKNAAALGKAVETVETGCRNIIDYANEETGIPFTGHYQINSSFNGTATSNSNRISGKNLFINGASLFGTKALSASDSKTYKNLIKSYNGTAASPAVTSFASNYAVHEKTGIYLGAYRYNETDSNIEDPIIETVLVDVNGPASPNRYGVDIFVFGLTDECHMIPAGTERLNTVTSGKTGIESTDCISGNITNGLACTSKVVRDGYTIKY